MSPPTPPSPPIISRDEDYHRRASSRTRHRQRASSRSRSRGRSRGRVARSPDRRHRQRSHSRGHSREHGRYQSSRRLDRPRHDRSRSKSKLRSERRRLNSHRSRSRSYSRTQKSSYKSRSRSRSHKRSNRSKSRSKEPREARGNRSQSSRREERRGSSKQANVIVLSTESYKDSLKSSNRLSSVQEEAASSSSSRSTLKPTAGKESTPSWKTVKADQVGVYSNLEPDEPIDKEKIHKEIEEKLRLALAREGKVYPYPKPEPSHPVFANDGSFLEIFKKMQQQQTFVQQQVGESMHIHAVPAAPVVSQMPVMQQPQQQQQHHHPPPPPQLPIFGRRRGGKILKTGVVAKPKAQNDTDTGDVKDFWSIYLREVKKYKSTACESDSKTRPLVR